MLETCGCERNTGKMDRLIFVSNFFNHHQKPFSDAMYARLGGNYLFIETGVMTQERKNMGWGLSELPSYVVPRDMLQANLQRYAQLIEEADAVIIGSAPNALVQKRIKANKLVFRYSERPLKKGLELWKYPYRLLKWHRMNPRGKRIYMLCASAYTASDYAKFGLFRNRCFKWGYFPKTEHYSDISALIDHKQENTLVWVARYIDWKHPEIAVEIGRRLKTDGYRFVLNMIGNGEMLDQIKDRVHQEGLDDVIKIRGAMTPEEVRGYMEQARIHIFTSDRQEGWGAVLNESMNSACVPVANREIGSAPFLIEDGENGYTYRTVDELYQKVRYLLDHPEERNRMAQNAYRTITEEWNAEVAAERLSNLCEAMKKGKMEWYTSEQGVCSQYR